jgi:hypothetical protein
MSACEIDVPVHVDVITCAHGFGFLERVWRDAGCGGARA